MMKLEELRKKLIEEKYFRNWFSPNWSDVTSIFKWNTDDSL